MQVVICAAGIGSRLGLGIPKCLAEVRGKSLISRTMDILSQSNDKITLVSGFCHEQVVQAVKGYELTVIQNVSFATTSVVDSVRLGLGSSEEVIVLDGDVLFTIEDYRRLRSAPNPVICVTPNISDHHPVLVETTDKQVVQFDVSVARYEWAGLCKVPSYYFNGDYKYIFEALEQHLPLPYLVVDSIEIDTPIDLLEAEKWIDKRSMSFGKLDLT